MVDIYKEFYAGRTWDEILQTDAVSHLLSLFPTGEELLRCGADENLEPIDYLLQIVRALICLRVDIHHEWFVRV